MRDSVLTAERLFESCGHVIPFEKALLSSGDDTSRRLQNYNMSQRWLDTYQSKGLRKVDPIVREVSQGSNIFLWTRLHAKYDRDPHVSAFFEEARLFGLSFGVSYAYSNSDKLDLFTFAGSGNDFTAQHVDVLSFLTPHLKLWLDSRDSQRPEVDLTRREVEVLKWSHDGATASAMATKMCCTERTINFHLGNIYRKLGVNNRTAAVAVALKSKIISY